MLEKKIKITIDDFTLDLNEADINIHCEMTNKIEPDYAIITIYNASSLSESFRDLYKEASIEIGDEKTTNLVFKGVYVKFDNLENKTDNRFILYCTDNPTLLFHTLINRNFKITNYTEMITRIANDIGLGIGDINIKNDINFSSYTVYKNLYDFLDEISFNTNSTAYIKRNEIYISPKDGETTTVEILKENILQKKYIKDGKYKLLLDNVFGEVEPNIKIDIEGEILLVQKVLHFSSVSTGEHFTEAEILDISS